MHRRITDATGGWDVIVDNLHESIITTDAEGHITNWNKGAERLFGYSAEEAIGLHASICHQRDANAMLREIVEPLQRDGHANVFGKMVHKSGKTFDGHMLASLIKSSDGTVTGMVGYTLDITERKQAEAALRDSEASLKALTELSPTGIYRSAPDGHLTYANDRWRALMGVEGDAALGQSWIDAVHPEDQEATVKAWQEYVNGEVEKYQIDCRVIRPDGSIVWLIGQANKDYGENGELLGYVGSITDITERKRVEQALAESEERFTLAMRGANDGMWDRHLETGEFYYSPRWFEMLGYRSDELPNTNEAWETLLHPDDLQKIDEFVTSCLEGEGRNCEVEFRMRHKDGHYVDILGRGFAARDDAGTPIRLVGTNSDISGRKQAEGELLAAKTLAESGERIRSAFENIAIGNLVISDEGIIEIFNSAAGKIFGYTAEEVVGQSVEMLMPETSRCHHNGYIRNYLETGEAKIIGVGREVTGLRKNGEEFPMHLDVGEMVVGDEVSFIGSVTDLTEMKHLEEQVRRSQRLEAVGQLTGGVAHDFNNLLAIMIGNAELLAETVSEDEDVRKRTGAIIDAVERGSSLTQRLLAFSRQQTLSPVAKDVAELIDGLEDMLKRALGETVDLRVADMPDLWPATIDPHQFENALVNLAINARDAMPDGGALTIEAANVTLDEIFVASLEDVEPGDYVKVAVSDTGTGMSPEVLEKVFEPFFTTKEVGKGSGLGLSMVYGFVKQSGGHVTIYSEVGIGTTIKVYLPRSVAAADRDDTRDHAPNLERGSERILIVEDDADVRVVAVGLLQSQGYEIAEAQDGAEAIAHLTGGKAFDLLFTDVVLPGGMNGVEIVEQAKRLQPNIKVLFTTGYAENAFAHTGQSDPGVVVVNKPYRRTELLGKVRSRLDSDEV